MNKHELLTTEQAAERLNVTRNRVLAMIYAKRLPAQKFGNVWMIQARDLEKVKDRRPGRPPKEGGESNGNQ